MNKETLMELLSDLIDKGEEVSFNVHVGQYHQPSFVARTKEEAQYLVERTTAALGEESFIEELENDKAGTRSYLVRREKGLGYHFCFSYKEDK